jgi:hypothetical protein
VGIRVAFSTVEDLESHCDPELTGEPQAARIGSTTKSADGALDVEGLGEGERAPAIAARPAEPNSPHYSSTTTQLGDRMRRRYNIK